MNKIQIILEIPSIKKQYELILPVHLTVREFLEMVSESLEKITNGVYVSSHEELLCTKDNKQLLGMNYTLQDYHILNGDHLIIF